MPHKKRALVLDQEPKALLLVAEFLIHRGLEVLTATNAHHALQVIGKHCERPGEGFGLIITEVEVDGGMDGLEFVRRAKRLDPRLTCVLHTALERINGLLEQEASRAGITSILPKPLDLGRLQRLLEMMQHGPQQAATATAARTTQAATGTHRRGLVAAAPETAVDATPFFGLNRISGDTGRYHREDEHTGKRQPQQSDSEGSRYSRHDSSDIFEPSTSQGSRGPHRPLSVPPPPGPSPVGGTPTRPPVSGTSRYHRIASDLPEDLPAARMETTARIRRAVTGRITAPTAAPAPDQQPRVEVRCARCQRSFAVIQRSERYTVPCIHCGQINTIPARRV